MIVFTERAKKRLRLALEEYSGKSRDERDGIEIAILATQPIFPILRMIYSLFGKQINYCWPWSIGWDCLLAYRKDHPRGWPDE